MALAEFINTFIYDIAMICYAIIDMIGAEIILSAIVNVDEDNNVKLTFGGNEFKSTVVFVLAFLLAGIIFYAISNYAQDFVVSKLQTLGMKIIPLFFFLWGFGAFYASKIILSRRWGNVAVMVSTTISLVSFSIFAISILYF